MHRSCTDKTLASTLGISVEQYKEIETGDQLMTRKQAQKLGRLFKVDSKYIYDCAMLIDEYKTKDTILTITKNSLFSVLDRLEALIEKLANEMSSKPPIEQ